MLTVKTHILIVLVCVTYGVRVSGLGLHLYVYIDLNPHGPYVNKMFVEIWRDKSSKASRCVAHENESMRSGERRYFSHPEASEVICVKKIRERHLCQSPLGNICVPCGTTGPLFTLSQQTVAYVQGQGNWVRIMRTWHDTCGGDGGGDNCVMPSKMASFPHKINTIFANQTQITALTFHKQK